MKKGMRYVSTLVALSIFFLLYSCSKPQTPFDPCMNYVPFNGGMNIQQEIGDTLFSADTIFTTCNLHFSPIGSGIDSCLWQIGYSAPFVTKADTRKYIQINSNQSFTVNLSAYRHAGTVCPAKDTLVYNFSKPLYAVDMNQSVLPGNYRGISSENTKDTFTVKISFIANPLPYFFLLNFPNGCTRGYYMADYPLNIGYPISAGYKVFHLDGTSCLPNVHGNGMLTSRDSLEIQYYKMLDTGARKYLTFRARRI